MRLPPGAIGVATTRVLLAVVDVYQCDGRATVRDVTAAAGLASIGTTWPQLLRLADLGLVTWAPHTRGTLRPLIRPVLAPVT